MSAFEDADRLLRTEPLLLDDISPLGMRLRLRAADRLSQRFETELRGGVPAFSTEAAAMAFLKGSARYLRAAAAELLRAAERLREKGEALAANRAHLAAREAAAAADEIDPN